MENNSIQIRNEERSVVINGVNFDIKNVTNARQAQIMINEADTFTEHFPFIVAKLCEKVRDNKLYLTDRDSKGKQSYKSFDKWADDKLSIGKSSANNKAHIAPYVDESGLFTVFKDIVTVDFGYTQLVNVLIPFVKDVVVYKQFNNVVVTDEKGKAVVDEKATINAKIERLRSLIVEKSLDGSMSVNSLKKALKAKELKEIETETATEVETETATEVETETATEVETETKAENDTKVKLSLTHSQINAILMYIEHGKADEKTLATALKAIKKAVKE